MWATAKWVASVVSKVVRVFEGLGFLGSALWIWPDSRRRLPLAPRPD